MGTNYFAFGTTHEDCDEAGQLHVGKSSSGWCFSLAVRKGLQSLADWQELWSLPGVQIKDEYGRPVTPEQMIKQITGRSWGRASSGDPDGYPALDRAEWLRQNCAVEGPNGLARHTYEARPPEGEPNATYDLVEGWFR
jgi:hypothetical protein